MGDGYEWELWLFLRRGIPNDQNTCEKTLQSTNQNKELPFVLIGMTNWKVDNGY